jgi:hypothetical protein
MLSGTMKDAKVGGRWGVRRRVSVKFGLGREVEKLAYGVHTSVIGIGGKE